ncbi:MAG: thioredoxin family protein [Pseudomonadota bacterium]
MKRKSKKQRHQGKRTKRSGNEAVTTNTNASAGLDRRSFLGRFRNWAIVGALSVGAGWYLVSETTAMIAEHDLTRVGNGKPAVVQIHDPQCPRCRALQKEARSALSDLDDPNVQYLVANIKSSSGQSFASKHQVAHITLVLFDGQGRRMAVLRGNRSSNELLNSFRVHLGSKK